jgi:hypothetical protein
MVSTDSPYPVFEVISSSINIPEMTRLTMRPNLIFERFIDVKYNRANRITLDHIYQPGIEILLVQMRIRHTTFRTISVIQAQVLFQERAGPSTKDESF